MFCKSVLMKLTYENFVMHNEPRYTYPAAYKTTDDLLHLFNRCNYIVIRSSNVFDLYRKLVIT